MANYKTGAQRYNDRKDKIISGAREIERKRVAAGEKPNPNLTDTPKKRTTSDGYMPRTDKGKGLVGNSGLKGHGVNSPAMMKARSENKAKQRTAQ